MVGHGGVHNGLTPAALSKISAMWPPPCSTVTRRSAFSIVAARRPRYVKGTMATKISSRSSTQDAIDAGAGILRLEPCWVPRTFMIPGRRLRLHPDDLYALGAHRGGINERWFCSTTHASNGPGTPEDEGLSYVRLEDGTR